MTIRDGGPASSDGAGRRGETTELIALSFGRGRDLVRNLYRIWDRGLAALPLDPLLPQPALARQLELFRPSRLLGDSGQQVLQGAPVEAETALVIPTSGSTGTPKGVELTHEALDRSARASVAALEHPDGRWLCCLPLHHIAGLMVILRAQLEGSLPAIHDRFDEDAIEGETGAELISLVPAMLKRLLERGADLSRYRAILLGGGPIPQELIAKAVSRGARIVSTYGMTETCGGCVYDGRPLEGVGLKLQGEQILLRGPMLFSGYRLRPDLTAIALRDGWFSTSDRGRISGNGRLEVLGRLDDLIITGGRKVAPDEVESILMEHPAITEAAVAGLSSERWGQEIAAAVVFRPGGRLESDEIRDFVSSRAPRWMAPKRIVEVRVIPKSTTGKVLRDEIARLFEEGVDRFPG